MKVRYLVVIIAFVTQTVFFYQHITMGASIIAMVNNSALEHEDSTIADTCAVNNFKADNASTENDAQVEGEFLWSPKIQGYIHGSCFFCSVLAKPFSASVAQAYGGKKVLFWCLCSTSILIFCIPFAAYWNIYALIVIQGIRGLFQSGCTPALGILVANWCPKQERGVSYSFIITGCNVGSVLGSYLSGLLCESTYLGGWKSSFFVAGSLGFLVSYLLWYFLYDNPSVHPKLSLAELHYIINNQENVLTEKRPKTPWKKLFTSVPVYALAYVLFGQIWIMSHFISIHSTFLKTILHLSVEQSGLFTALPFILAVLFTQIGASLSTLLISRNLVSIDKARKFLTLMSSVAYSCCLVAICFAECNGPVIIILSILAFGISGVSDAGCWIVCNDMSPTFSASIIAITETIGTLAYVILPLIVGYLTDYAQTIEQWHKIFLICITVVLSSSIMFVIFGSAEIQPWNDVIEEKSEVPNTKRNSLRASQN